MIWRHSSLRLLFTWMRWLAIHHPSVRMVNVTLPICAFLVCVMAALWLPSLNFTKGSGIIQQVNGLLQILAPFFVAALVLIAGFPGHALDEAMGGQRPYLWIAGERHEPSRRELLGHLFAYLSGSSVLIYLFGGLVVAAANPTTQPALAVLASLVHGYLGLAFKAAYCAVVVHVFSVTLLGLNFLGNFLSSSRISRAPSPLPGPEGHGPPSGQAPSSFAPIAPDRRSREIRDRREMRR